MLEVTGYACASAVFNCFALFLGTRGFGRVAPRPNRVAYLAAAVHGALNGVLIVLLPPPRYGSLRLLIC